MARETLPAKGWDPHLPRFRDSVLGEGKGTGKGLHSCFYGNHRVCPRKELPSPGDPEGGSQRGTCCSCPCKGKVNESLRFLGFLATVLTLPTTYPWGAEEGLPVPGWCEISISPPEQRSTEGGGLALNTSCLRARKSRSLVHQARSHSPLRRRGD